MCEHAILTVASNGLTTNESQCSAITLQDCKSLSDNQLVGIEEDIELRR